MCPVPVIEIETTHEFSSLDQGYTSLNSSGFSCLNSLLHCLDGHQGWLIVCLLLWMWWNFGSFAALIIGHVYWIMFTHLEMPQGGVYLFCLLMLWPILHVICMCILWIDIVSRGMMWKEMHLFDLSRWSHHDFWMFGTIIEFHFGMFVCVEVKVFIAFLFFHLCLFGVRK